MLFLSPAPRRCSFAPAPAPASARTNESLSSAVSVNRASRNHLDNYSPARPALYPTCPTVVPTPSPGRHAGPPLLSNRFHKYSMLDAVPRELQNFRAISLVSRTLRPLYAWIRLTRGCVTILRGISAELDTVRNGLLRCIVSSDTGLAGLTSFGRWTLFDN